MVKASLSTTSLITSLVSCYGMLGLVTILSFAGITVRINDRIWGAVIVGFAALTLVGLALNWRRHRRVGPIVLGAAGFALIAWVMFGDYNNVLEAIGFGFLLIATTLDIRQCRSGPVCAQNSSSDLVTNPQPALDINYRMQFRRVGATT